MIQKLKNKLLVIAALLTLGAPAILPATVHAVNYSTDNIQSSLCQGSVLNVNQTSQTGTAACDDGTNGGTGGLNNLLKHAVNIISGIVGVVAVIMIIIGGFRYITSGGDSNKVSAAKNTLIYAIIGLVIVALAQLIVHFVIGQAGNLGS